MGVRDGDGGMPTISRLNANEYAATRRSAAWEEEEEAECGWVHGTRYTVHGTRYAAHGTRRGTYLNVHFE